MSSTVYILIVIIFFTHFTLLSVIMQKMHFALMSVCFFYFFTIIFSTETDKREVQSHHLPSTKLGKDAVFFDGWETRRNIQIRYEDEKFIALLLLKNIRVERKYQYTWVILNEITKRLYKLVIHSLHAKIHER